VKAQEKSYDYRRSRLASAATILSAFLLLILVNYFSMRHFWTFDLTTTREFTLSDKTTTLLKSLEKPLQIYVFGNVEPQVENYLRRLLMLYEQASGNKVEYRFVNPDLEADRAVALTLRDRFELTLPENLLLIELGERRGTLRIDELYELSPPDILTGAPRRITSWLAEEKISSKIVELLLDRKGVVYFLQGHREGDWRDKETPQGYGEAASRIERDFFEVRGLHLLLEGTVPQDADLLVINGPLTPLHAQEVEALSAYLSRGGRLLVCLDWDSNSGLEEFLAERGIIVRREKLLGRISRIVGGIEVREFGSTVPLLERDYTNHPILRSLRSQTILLPNLRALEIQQPKLPGWTATALLRAPSAFWGESGNWDENAQFDEGEDVQGPIPVAAVSENDKNARIVVFSGALAFNNRNIYLQPGAADLWSNTVNWLTGKNNLLGVGPRQAREFRLRITDFQLVLLFTFTVIAIPFAILCWAAIVWFERRC